MNRKRLALLAFLFALGAAVPAQEGAGSFGRYKPAPQFTEAITSSFYLPMRDGVKIALQVTRPAVAGVPAPGKFPVIWEAALALPADAPSSGAAVAASWNDLVKHGYVMVVAARRGNGASFGVRRGYHDREEAYDAYEITDWLAHQPWSSGMVGMHGCSNTGEAVLHALSVAPPALRAAWAGCFSWSKYDNFLRGGGIIANWGSGPQRTLEQDMRSRPIDADQDKVLLREAATEHLQNVDLAALLRSIPYRDSFSPLTHSRFAVEGSASSYAAQIRRAGTALYIQGGWQDDGRRDAFIALANLPGARVLMGNWKHCRLIDFDWVAEALRFFDFYLKGIDTGIARDDPIHYVAVDSTASGGRGGEWHSAKQWPLPEARATVAFLTAGRTTGGLADTVGKRDGQMRFAVDYATTCNVPGVNLDDVTGLQPCHPLTGSASFTGARLHADTRLAGHPVISLWISADAPEVNLFAYLEDVAPDGTVTAITEGRQKASLRKLDEAPWKMIGLPWHRGFRKDAQPLLAGVPVELRFDLLPVSYVFGKGHRIQVSVAGADYRERGRAQVSPAPTITIYSGGERASAITLPVLPGR